jgi:hypothetical protein
MLGISKISKYKQALEREVAWKHRGFQQTAKKLQII